MNGEQFAIEALKTESRPEGLNISNTTLMHVLDMATSAGNIVDAFKKKIFYGKKIDNNTIGTQEIRASISANWLLSNSLYEVQTGTELDIPNTPEFSEPNMRLLHAAMGMYTEATELLEAIAKQIMTGELDKTNFAEEIGDLDWYKAIAHDETGVSEEQVRATNIAKLRKRYPGKFDSDAAINRDLEAERAILEEGVGK